MKSVSLSILGSTGSIGTQTLEIVEENRDRFRVVALSANSNWELLAEQANRFRPDYLLLCSEANRREFEARLAYRPTEILYNPTDLSGLATLTEVDIVLNSLVGFAGFPPTLAAIRAGKRVALANKESLVVGGEILADLLKKNPEQLLPVDSEHSAMLQCLAGERFASVEKIVITASGGPFRTWNRRKMGEITVEDALDHPNWSMGAKISIDSATMMNKGLEVIEAKWIFNLPIRQIEPVVHPQSIVHSIVEFVDGSSKAQLSLPDMKGPIMYALGYPERLPLGTPRMDWTVPQNLTFEPIDHDRFPCLQLAIDAGEAGGFAPAVLNAANEVAVERFLKREIGYIEIARVVEKSLERIQAGTELTPDSLIEVDREARRLANEI